MKIQKLFTKKWGVFVQAFLMLCLLLSAAPLSPPPACVPNDRAFQGYTFINMELLPEKKRQVLAPLFMRFDRLYGDYFETTAKAVRDENLAEWHERFCGEVKTEDISFMIYGSTIEGLEQLLTNTRSKSLTVPEVLKDNTFAQFVWEKKCTETLEYLIFAKRCEPHVTVNDQWKVLPRDKAVMDGLIANGKKAFKRTKSAYIRLRYAYQIIRLAHYSGQYQLTLDLYNELIPQVDKMLSRWADSVIPWWIQGHRAGALLKLGENVEASYLYAQIFQNCPGRRASAFQSFSIKTDEEWERCMRFCESDDERATLFTIRAAGEESKALDDMRRIYEIDPLNENLEVLLVQEMRKMERNLLGLEFNDHRGQNKRYHQIPKPYAGNYVIALQKFVRQCREEGQVARPELWQIAEGYLEFLAGDFYAADKTFREVSVKTGDKKLQEQLLAFQLALKIAAFDKPNEAVETAAYDIMKEEKLYVRYKSFPDYLRDQMTFLYEKYDQKGKAFLCQYPLSYMKPNPSEDLINDLLATALKPEQTTFERLLMEAHSASDLLDIKATMYMSRGQLEAAFETYKRIPAGEWENYGQFDPFTETFRDCISCPRPDGGTLSTKFNKGELLAELLDLEYKSKGDIDGAAVHYFKLGLGYYNLSYFGYEWAAMDFFRSGSTWPKLRSGTGEVFSHWKYPLGNKENVDLSKALYCFERARLLANTPELAARAAFQAARCEQKIYFLSEGYKAPTCKNCIPRLPEEYLVNFGRLKEKYSDTEFYKLVIKECKYYQAYLRR